MSYDPDHVGTRQMLEAIKETGFRPSIARSRVALSVAKKSHGELPPMIQDALYQANIEG